MISRVQYKQTCMAGVPLLSIPVNLALSVHFYDPWTLAIYGLFAAGILQYSTILYLPNLLRTEIVRVRTIFLLSVVVVENSSNFCAICSSGVGPEIEVVGILGSD